MPTIFFFLCEWSNCEYVKSVVSLFGNQCYWINFIMSALAECRSPAYLYTGNIYMEWICQQCIYNYTCENACIPVGW